jgi:replication-associated recombination protein RarA
MSLFDGAIQQPESIQVGFQFPQSLADKYQPKRIEDFIGLEKPKKIFAKLLAKPFSSAWTLVGPSGTGKTSMAMALANQIPAELKHIPSRNCDLQTVESVCAHCYYVPWSGKLMHFVLVDEADQMTLPAQHGWLSKLDQTAMPPATVFVFTCNSIAGLEERFLSRTHVVEFSSYGMAPQMIALLKRVWAAECTNSAAPPPNFARIVKDSCNNVRDALMKLEVALMEI